MKRAALGVVTAAIAVVLVGAAPAAAAAALKLTPVAAKFPERSFVLTLPPGVAVEPDAVQVLENGEPVADLAIAPTSGQADSFGTVLLIDASESMKGKAMKAAMRAARVFARHRKPGQKLAVVAYNAETTVLVPYTTDEAQIAKALAQTPPVAYYTRMYDAVEEVVSLTRREQLRSAAIVLLSDGQELGSNSSFMAAAAAARSAGMRIFSVALLSRFFDSETLRSLAERSGGEYLVATSPEALVGIYDKLGFRLANEYFVQYKSFAGPDQDVTVSLRVGASEALATATYRAPKLPSAPPAAPFQRSALDQFVQSRLTMIIVALVIAALLGLMAVTMFQPRRGGVLTRLGAFISLAQPEEAKRQTAALSERLLSRTDKSLSRTAWWARFKEQVDVAEVRLPPDQIIVLTLVTTLLAGWLATLVVPTAFVPLALLIPFAVYTFIRQKAERQRRAFSEQLPDNLQVLSSALRAGHSLIGALSVVVDDAPEPSRKEFRRVVTDEQLGVPIEDALTRVGARMQSRDLDQVALVAALQRQTGGNSAEVLDQVATTIRDRAALRRLVRTLTAQGRMARWIISGLPVALLVFISIINKAYLEPLYSHTAGQLMLVGAAAMVVAGSLTIKKIINIKV